MLLFSVKEMRQLYAINLPPQKEPVVVYIKPRGPVAIFIEGNTIIVQSKKTFSLDLILPDGRTIPFCEHVNPGSYCYTFPKNYKVGIWYGTPIESLSFLAPF